jgi:hypothetical protein
MDASGSDRVLTKKSLPTLPFAMNVFSPLRSQSSPTRSARSLQPDFGASAGG